MSYLRWRTFQILRSAGFVRENFDANPEGAASFAAYPDSPLYVDCVVYDSSGTPITDGSIEWVLDWEPVGESPEGELPGYLDIDGALTFNLDSYGYDETGAPPVWKDGSMVRPGILTIRAKDANGVFFDGTLALSASLPDGWWNEYIDTYSDIAWLTVGEPDAPLFWTNFVKTKERQI